MFYDEGPNEEGGEDESGEEEEWTQVVHDDRAHSFVPNQASHDRVIVHIDIDCFYAQVEMINEPELADKPLGIQQKNILVTCNYVARRHGLTKLMFLKDAQQKCPQLIIRNGEDLTKYREMSAKIFNVLLQYSPLVEKLGLDENYVDVTAMVDVPPWKDMADKPVEGHIYGTHTQQGACCCGCVGRLTIGAHICTELRRALHTELGITSCGGIAHNKLLAKVAGEQNKPNAQTLLFPGQERRLMESLGSVRKVPGIGHAMSKTLSSLGVLSVADLAERPLAELSGSLGHHTAQRLLQLAHGIDDTAVTPTGKPQSMSDEDSFKKCSSIEDFKCRTTSMVASLLNRLLTDGRHPSTLRLTIRKFDPNRKNFGRESRQGPLPTYLFHNLNSESLKRTSIRVVDLCLDLFQKMIDSNSTKSFHLTLINVCFAKFTDITGKNRGIGAFLQAKQEMDPTMEDSTMSDDEQGVETEPGLKHTMEKSPTVKHQSSNSMASFMSPKRKVGNCSESTLQKESEETERTPKKKTRRIENFFSPKICDNEGSNSSSVITQESVENSQKEAFNSTVSDSVEDTLTVSELPHGIDMDTFHELPPDIQKEILGSKDSTKSHCSSQVAEGRDTNIEASNSKRSDPKALGTSHSSHTSDRSDSSHFSKSSHSSHSSNNSHSSHSSNTSHSSNSNQLLDPCKMTLINLPPGIDPDVFSQLPPDVQKSVLSEHHAQNVQKEFKQMKNLKSPPSKKAKRSGCEQTNISSFFKKK